ncbi:alpha-mannosidase 2C1-like [Centruroides sculpturatus]|uniref:alpha-mannosidase 2C1-like n=1 Tax=Centruroides sculpturatus TaxID=218467 RepID=UPI000C6DEE0A|nr:alpha-mannosidase 2C1-like [Centruroides sculpturatus]
MLVTIESPPVEFPVNVLSRQATFEIQYGHIQRPTHFNTSWDWAKYEVYAHKWIDVSEHDWGVALLNTNKYGHAVHSNVIRLSLLRASKSPDPTADIGEHRFSYALMPHTGSFQQAGVIQQSYQLTCPLQLYLTNNPGSHHPPPGFTMHRVLPLEIHESLSWFQVSDSAVIIDAVKKAEDREGCLLVRLYEAYGSRVKVTLRSCLPIIKVTLCNALEDIVNEPGGEVMWKGGSVELNFTPFQVISLLLYLEM